MVGLFGESDLAASYAIYGVLDELGCRWYMPSELGEVIPALPTITLERVTTVSLLTRSTGAFGTATQFIRDAIARVDCLLPPGMPSRAM